MDYSAASAPSFSPARTLSADYSRSGKVGDYAGTNRRHRGRAAGRNRARPEYPPARRLSYGALCGFGRRETDSTSHIVRLKRTGTIGVAHVSPALAATGEA